MAHAHPGTVTHYTICSAPGVLITANCRALLASVHLQSCDTTSCRDQCRYPLTAPWRHTDNNQLNLLPCNSPSDSLWYRDGRFLCLRILCRRLLLRIPFGYIFLCYLLSSPHLGRIKRNLHPLFRRQVWEQFLSELRHNRVTVKSKRKRRCAEELVYPSDLQFRMTVCFFLGRFRDALFMARSGYTWNPDIISKHDLHIHAQIFIRCPTDDIA